MNGSGSPGASSITPIASRIIAKCCFLATNRRSLRFPVPGSPEAQPVVRIPLPDHFDHRSRVWRMAWEFPFVIKVRVPRTLPPALARTAFHSFPYCCAAHAELLRQLRLEGSWSPGLTFLHGWTPRSVLLFARRGRAVWNCLVHEFLSGAEWDSTRGRSACLPLVFGAPA